MNNQLNMYGFILPKYKITKPVRLIELDNLKIIVYKDGKIKTCFHNNIRKNGRIMNTKGRLLKPSLDKYGYYRITLSNNGKRKSYYVHRLVARAYLKKYSDKLQVNHKNGIKTDNRIENLEMVTLQENIKHSIETGLKPKLKRDKYGRFSGKEVMQNEEPVKYV